MMRGIFLLFMVLAAGVVVAVRMLPWWAVPALFAALALAVVITLRWGLTRLLKLPFKAKGAVLRDATVDVHSIERAEAQTPEPSKEPGLAGAPGPHEHFRLDVTITPRAPSGPFTLWEPGELRIVGQDARTGEPKPGEAHFDVRIFEVLEDGHFEQDSGMKYEGPQRLRLMVGVPPGQRRLRFRYYFEVFGSISLPGAATESTFSRRPLATTP
jgi:hypothetical protein